MAEIKPLNALHYNLAAIPSLADVVAPPYDVIDAARRAELLARSPFNVVEIDLPEAPEGGDRYEHADETLEEWTLQGILAADREPALWALTQEYDAPDGSRQARRGLLCRVRVTPVRRRPRAPARAHPAGAEAGPAAADRGDPPQPLADLLAARGRRLAPPRGVHPRASPGPRSPTTTGTVHRIWRIGDPDAHRAVAAELADSELLIADGHHRYETARTYADAIGGDGPHRYTLMALVSLEDPGLTVFGYHRLLTDLGDARRAGGAPRRAARATSRSTEVPLEQLDPPARRGSASSATSTPTTARAFACGSRTRRSLRGRDPRHLAPPSASSTPRSSRR